MAARSFSPFTNGPRLTDGTKLNDLCQGREQMSPAINGSVQTGSLVTPPTVVAAIGATQGGAALLSAAAFVFIITATASTEGVKLPTAATGKQIELWCNPTVGAKVYANAAGQKIGTATTNTTAFALVKNTTTVFLAQNKTQWLVAKGS